MSTETFLPVPSVENEVDTDGMPLNGLELQVAVLRDLQEMVEEVKARLQNSPDISKHYAFPRVRWEIHLKITPYYTDEKPVELNLESSSHLDGNAGADITLDHERGPIHDADKLRPEKQRPDAPKEAEHEDPVHPLNPMVRQVK